MDWSPPLRGSTSSTTSAAGTRPRLLAPAYGPAPPLRHHPNVFRGVVDAVTRKVHTRPCTLGAQLDAYRQGFRSSYRHHGDAIVNGSDGRTRPVRLTELRIGV